MPDVPEKPERLATFPLARDEVTLFAIIHTAKKDPGKRTFRLTLEVDWNGIIILERKEYMRAVIAA